MVYKVKKYSDHSYIENVEIKTRIDRYLLKPYRVTTTIDDRSILIRENLDLLGRIYTINHTHGSTTNYEPKAQVRNDCDTLRRTVLNRTLEKQNRILDDRFKKAKMTVPSSYVGKSWRQTVSYIKKICKQPVVLDDLLEKPPLLLGNECRPIIYFDIEDVRNLKIIGRMIFLLYIDMLPNTVEMFIKLCENHKIYDEETRKENNIPCLAGTEFNRIFPNLYCEGGSIDNLDLDYYSYPENFHLSHDALGTLSLTPSAHGMCNTQFSISLRPLKVLNGKRVAFGRCIKGTNMLDAISAFSTKKGKPNSPVRIADCGLIRTGRFKDYEVYR